MKPRIKRKLLLEQVKSFTSFSTAQVNMLFKSNNRLPLFLASLLVSCSIHSPLNANEITNPSQLPDKIKPDAAANFVYTEDGEFGKKLNLPTYEWMPASGQELKGIIIGIHGLTLHGRRFRVLARTLAQYNIGFVSMDMRGFGRCKFDDAKQFSTKADNKSKINHEKSFQDIVALTKLVNEKYPNVPIMALGESLGCTFCVRLAAEQKGLVEGIVLSAPAVKLNAKMYADPGQLAQIAKGLLISPTGTIDLKTFLSKLVSSRKEVIDEVLEDPLMLKKIHLTDLIATDLFVEKTIKYGKATDSKLAVLLIQGSADGCVAPKAVTDLMAVMPSADQTLRWLGPVGHLQFETAFVRSTVIDAVGDWLNDHSNDAATERTKLEQAISDVGGVLVR